MSKNGFDTGAIPEMLSGESSQGQENNGSNNQQSARALGGQKIKTAREVSTVKIETLVQEGIKT
jgi:hypothetical protein